MKKFIVVLSFIFVSSAFAQVRPITIRDVTARVSNDNYFVLQNAQRVYQAKQSIQLARRNLLPKLNIWRIIETPFSAKGLLGLVGDIVPFLVPNNWIRVQEEKLFAEATTLSYRALWANELLTARGLFMQASLEERLYESMEANSSDLARIYEMVKVREAIGAVPPGSTTQVEILVLSARDQSQTMKRVIHENRSQLAFILGFPGNDEAVPTQIQYVSQQSTNELQYPDYEGRVLNSSPEVKQFSSLIRAADHVKKERYFTFLGSSQLARGASGGIFDALPMQDGLGFGLAPSIRIVKSQKNMLILQQNAVVETLRKDLKILIDSYNMDMGLRQDAMKRVSLAENLFMSLEDRMRMGEAIDSLELIQASEARMNALSAYHSIEVRLLLNADRLLRMTLADVYSAAR